MQYSEADTLEGALRHKNMLFLLYIYLKKLYIIHALSRYEMKYWMSQK